METIGKQELWSFLDNTAEAVPVRKHDNVRKKEGCFVTSFIELAEKVAELQFRNQEHVLLFRGQAADHREETLTSLKPSLLRPDNNVLPDESTLNNRFSELTRAEERLVAEYEEAKFIAIERLKRQQILRWAIIQHYEICPTPLLDVTQSLRIAASFASLDSHVDAFVFVLGVPNLSGAVTASAEAGVQIVRLSSVCPPAAIRPHLQEGYLLGEYPEMGRYRQKQLYPHYETDFGRRLVAKFRFNPKSFWMKSSSFPKIRKDALYPTKDDVYELMQKVKR